MKNKSCLIAVLLMSAMILSAANEWGKGAGNISDWKFQYYNDIQYSDTEISGVTICQLGVISPFLASPALDWDASENDLLAVEIKSSSAARGHLYFGTETAPKYADERMIFYDTPGGDGKWHTMLIPLAHAYWKGKITSMRLTLLLEDGVSIAIRRIKLIRRDEIPDTLIQNGNFEMPGPNGIPLNWKATAGVSTVNENDNAVVALNGKAEITTEPFYIDFLEADTAAVNVSLQAKGKGTLTAILKTQDALGNDITEVEKTEAIDKQDFDTISFGEIQIPLSTARCFLTFKSAEGSAITIDNANVTQKKSRTLETWTGEWVRPGDKPDQPPRHMFFRKRFNVPEGMKNAFVAITGDNEIHGIFVNGNSIQPGKNALLYNAPDLVRIDQYLHAGENIIALHAYNFDETGAMIADVVLLSENGNTVFGTDETWLSSSDEQQGWTDANFDDAAWSKPICLGEGSKTPWGVMERPQTINKGKITLHSFKLTPKDGTPFAFEYSIDSTAVPAAGDYSVALNLSAFGEQLPQNGFRIHKIDLKAGRDTITGTITYPDFLPFGEITIKADVPGIVDAPLEAKLTVPKFPRPDCKVDMSVDSNGAPYLKYGEQDLGVIHHWCGTNGTIKEDRLGYVRDADLPFYVATKASGWGWRPDGKYDFSAVDKYVYELLEIDSNARFSLLVAVDNYLNSEIEVWLEAHPTECAMREDGTTKMGQIHGGKNIKVVSFASKDWRQELCRSMSALAAHLRNSTYGHRVLCLQPFSGMGGEWMMWGTFSSGAGIERLDYSRPFRLYFADFAIKKYGSLEAVNKAWRTEFASADDIRIPSPQERDKNDWFEFLDASKSKRIIDFRQAISELMADNVISLCDAVKTGSGEKMNAGCFYGYVTYITFPTWSEPGHFALGKVLNSGRVDYLTHLLRYTGRSAGQPGGFMTPESSLLLHGMVPFVQADIRTHRVDPADPIDAAYSRLNNLQESISVIQRDFSNALISGVGYEFGYFGKGWISSDRRMMETVRRCHEIETLARQKGTKRLDAENSIAVLVDEVSTYYSAQPSTVNNTSMNENIQTFYHAGVGMDTYLLSDLEKLPDYKCYVFLNAYHLTPGQMDYIEKKLKRNGKVLYFSFAAGVAGDDGIHTENVAKLTGIKTGLELKNFKSRIAYTNESEGFSKYLRGGIQAGNNIQIGPLFVPQEGDVLGTLQEGGTPALVSRTFKDHTVCYSSIPTLSQEFIRYMAEKAGITIINDNTSDNTYAADNLFAVHTIAGGKRHFRVPPKFKGKATELFTGREYNITDGGFDADLEPVSTVLYMLE